MCIAKFMEFQSGSYKSSGVRSQYEHAHTVAAREFTHSDPNCYEGSIKRHSSNLAELPPSETTSYLGILYANTIRLGLENNYIRC
jgi:hypothetical protein